MLNKPIVLLILDGWGYSKDTDYNAIHTANPKNFTHLWNHYPHKLINASQEAVGLPKGYIGNSEVGHLTLGAGRIIPHMLLQIQQAFAQREGNYLEILNESLEKKTNSIHLVGLLSDGGVHSHINHLCELIAELRLLTKTPIIIDAILDGRDTAPHSSLDFIKQIEHFCKKYPNVTIGSISGRWYAMDRDENWERTKAYADTLISTETKTKSPTTLIQQYHDQKITDEFIPPTKTAPSTHNQNDLYIFFNYRADRMRQLTAWMTNQVFPTKNHPMPEHKTITTNLITMTQYHKKFSTRYLFKPIQVENTLFERLHKEGIRTCAIAETEKYAHVTYFFNGGKEQQHPLEQRILIPSKKVASFDQAPEMSAKEITDALCSALAQNKADVYLVNLANADMVGHSGDFLATVKAIKTVDEQLGRIFSAVQKAHGSLIVTADHGNAEQMWNKEQNCPHTAHTCNPVPLIVTNQEQKLNSIAGLADIIKLFF